MMLRRRGSCSFGFGHEVGGTSEVACPYDGGSVGVARGSSGLDVDESGGGEMGYGQR